MEETVGRHGHGPDDRANVLEIRHERCHIGRKNRNGPLDMPADATFDTKQEFNRLAEGGFDRDQADAIVDHSKEILRGVATKEDLEHAEERLAARIDGSAKGTIIRLGGLMFALAVALGVIERLFPPPG